MLGEEESVIPPMHFVICLELLIHQPTSQVYHQLIKSLADHTIKTLIVSRYDENAPAQPDTFLFTSRKKQVCCTLC